MIGKNGQKIENPAGGARVESRLTLLCRASPVRSLSGGFEIWRELFGYCIGDFFFEGEDFHRYFLRVLQEPVGCLVLRVDLRAPVWFYLFLWVMSLIGS